MVPKQQVVEFLNLLMKFVARPESEIKKQVLNHLTILYLSMDIDLKPANPDIVIEKTPSSLAGADFHSIKEEDETAAKKIFTTYKVTEQMPAASARLPSGLKEEERLTAYVSTQTGCQISLK